MTPGLASQGMPGERRLVVFTGDLSASVCRGIVHVDRSIQGLAWLILVHAPRRRLGHLLRSQWANLRRNHWRWIPYVGAELWRRLVDRLRSRHAVDGPGHDYTPEALAGRPNVDIARVDDLHAPTSLHRVRDFAPELGIVLGAPILRRELFSLPGAGTLNLHKGRLPDYRGMPPAFWEMFNGEASVGCSVHWVDDKLDTGAIARRDAVPCDPFSTVRGLQLRLDEVGVHLVGQVVAEVLDGSSVRVPQGAGGRTFRKPTLAQVAALERRLATRHPPAEPRAKTMLKAALGQASRLAWRGGLSRVLEPRITVLLYHRVTDAVRDNLSVGIEQFDRQMALIRRHCQVLSLDEVLDASVIPRSRRPLVCVTFDDGYRDNHDIAVPILMRHQVPAAFFVATGMIGTDRPFPHDVQRRNGAIANMDWTQLRCMKEQGFIIGSHTVNHVDCASVPEESAWNELTGSRDDLRRELGSQDVYLGYPYGGRQHMNARCLDLVRQAGYSACLSAFGGTNLRHVDRFDVRRRAIHWGFSDQAFLRECVGLP
jgi:peptidoglycan/xylan/chitin deacetylase (PgdA/CDA1 family)